MKKTKLYLDFMTYIPLVYNISTNNRNAGHEIIELLYFFKI